MIIADGKDEKRGYFHALRKASSIKVLNGTFIRHFDFAKKESFDT